MKKIIQIIISFILTLLVISSLNTNKNVFAASTNTYGEWNKQTPLKHYKDIDLGFTSSTDNIDLFAKTTKRKPIRFRLNAGSHNYYINPILSKIKFKTSAIKKIDATVAGHTLKNAGIYRRVRTSKKKYAYLLSLQIPIKSIDPDLDQSTIMKVTPITTKAKKTSITTIGLSSFPIIPVIFGILFVLWTYFLSVLKRANINGIYFWVGSIGVFVIIAYFFHNTFSYIMSFYVSLVMNFIGNVTHLFTSILDQNLMYLMTQNNLVQLHINYECSGMLEFLVFESLLIFYPIFSVQEKLLRTFEGFIWILMANIIRILMVILSVKYFGLDSLFLVHSILSRIVYYVLTIVLYYNVFTKRQIIKGWRNR